MTYSRTRLREHRQRLGMTQYEMAAHLGTHQSRISSWESGREAPGERWEQEIGRCMEHDGAGGHEHQARQPRRDPAASAAARSKSMPRRKSQGRRMVDWTLARADGEGAERNTDAFKGTQFKEIELPETPRDFIQIRIVFESGLVGNVVVPKKMSRSDWERFDRAIEGYRPERENET